MPEHHKTPVVKIEEIFNHPNADKLEIIHVGGYQCVVGKGSFKVGDLAVYIYPDSVVPESPQFEFLWKDKGFGPGQVPVRYRRITAKRLRKEWSEGLLMPVSDFNDVWIGKHIMLNEGDDVAKTLGIEHYQPEESPEATTGANERGPQYRKYPRSLKGWFYFVLYKLGFNVNGRNHGWDNEPSPVGLPVYDVEAYKNYVNAFQPKEIVVVTEKIHGSNARYTYQNGKMYAGSRKLWKSKKAKCIWRSVLDEHPWIEQWCKKHPGYTLYGEVVPTQTFKSGDVVHYGVGKNEYQTSDFFPFDIFDNEGKWVSYSRLFESQKIGSENADLTDGLLSWVPILYVGEFNEEKIKSFVDGKSELANHIREGVVVRPLEERHVVGLGRLQLKIVSNDFLEKT